MKLSKEDIEQIENKGLSKEKIEEQIEIFKRGNIPVNILAAATLGNGIKEYAEEEKQEYSNYYDAHKKGLEIMKFVPASGAATRMFKALHVFLQEYDPQQQSIDAYLSRSENKKLKRFMLGLKDLPFYEKAVNYAKKDHPGFNDLTPDAQKYELVHTILFSPGLNLSNLPKGLVPFHDYHTYIATPFEEHLFEAAEYCAVNGKAKIHFTVSKGDKKKFEAEYDEFKSRLESKTNKKFEISFSYQDPKTDTIAVDEKNEPFRTQEGTLFFRPGGHGALIENLNDLDADLVFIKNIDNVVIASRVKEIAAYKKILAGKLLKLQLKCFSYLNTLDSKPISAETFSKIATFLEDELLRRLRSGFEDLSEDEKIRYLHEKLDRPLRVCGMVRNEGEPGGGPFLVQMENGETSLQIVESAQIDESDPEQQKIAQNATHFNPVDLVCGIKNYKGEAFDLKEYVDPATNFIADKTSDGKKLKALELPGLWNGGMAGWNTVFVEVPVSTFNPVKTVADLLKPTHQVNNN